MTSIDLFSSWQPYPAGALLLAGSLLAVRGLARLHAAFPRPLSTSMHALTWMRGFRLTLFGLALAGTGAGWLWDIPWLIALSLAVGFEETLETSFAISALRFHSPPSPVRTPTPGA